MGVEEEEASRYIGGGGGNFPELGTHLGEFVGEVDPWRGGDIGRKRDMHVVGICEVIISNGVEGIM